ncbi:hypothetical protein FQN50_001139 [Emmonsiellopsis sp. PD_5]|nr:hypothetical protein FQN50_001139 [Emmonsiellopsis sp. PD_5]
MEKGEKIKDTKRRVDDVVNYNIVDDMSHEFGLASLNRSERRARFDTDPVSDTPPVSESALRR